MKTPTQFKFSILMAILLAFTLFNTVEAKGPPIRVTESIPAEGVQETTPPVRLKGKGFGPGAQVTYIVHATGDVAPPEKMFASGVVYNPATEELEYTLVIAVDADVGDYDILVTLSGRKGKGTTLFNVQSSTKPRSGFTPDDITAAYVYDDGTNSLDMEEAASFTNPLSWDQSGDHIFGEGWNIWEANTLEEIPRPCRVGATLVDPPSAVRYDCFETASNGGEDDPHGGRVSFDLVGAGMVWEFVPEGAKRPFPDFCELLNNWGTLMVEPLRLGATRYDIALMDGCVEAHCPIEIGTASFNGIDKKSGKLLQLHPFWGLGGLNLGGTTLNLPDVGRFGVIGRTAVDGGGVKIPVDEANVFTLRQELIIEQFQIGFRKAKTGALLATCQTTVPVNNIWFITDPPAVP